ncbi:molybdopterin biosynthesis protein [Oleidesulfovibrio sp.]|uniref:molybdopterin biosynthesis protein n=1 Tax=Oleidesulfovibrio sp. TaxID=2909707 RepID=UPI003A8A0A38
MSSFKRNVYLKTVPIPQAVETVRNVLDRETLVRTEQVPAHEAAGRVTAEAVFARYSSPTFHSAAMDGFAVRAEDTFAAHEDAPVVLKVVQAGSSLPLQQGHAVAVNTGHPLPQGADAVIMIENIVEALPDSAQPKSVTIEAPAFPWQHVRRIGEDIVATELLFPQGHKINAYDVGTLLSGGIWDVSVYERIRVRIIPTGDEVLDFTTRPEPGPGQVVESNSQVLATLARSLGCHVERIPPVPDSPAAIQKAVSDALDDKMHLTIICAGSSAGSKDFTRSTIEALGEVLVHGIAAMPGKPSLMGICRGRLVAGAPGYPVSSVICFEELLTPLVSWLSRSETPQREEVHVELTRKVPSKLGVEEFMRLSVGRVGAKYVATPLGRGAGCITTLSKAQAVTRIPANAEGLEQNQTVPAELMVSRTSLERTLVCVGSHDNTLDTLADELMGLDTPFRLASSHVGSMGGIMAIKNGSCHMAGMHLFDPETGDYNVPFIRKYLPDTPAVLINLAIRHQGFIVPKGNPKGISGIEDITTRGLRFINRQRGAGTRILFDWYLKESGLSPDAVNGYRKEEYTHMAVAANVLTGSADCGLGIRAAARALGLDFVPLARERYDLLIPEQFMEDPRIMAVLQLLSSPAFLARIEALGGYETTLTGQVMQAGTALGESTR